MTKKRLINTVKIVLIVSSLFAFNALSSSQTHLPIKPSNSKGFIGLGFGINDYGTGIGVEFKGQDKLWLYGNAGLSTWGYRLTGGISFYPNGNGYRSSFSLGYSYASGVNDFEPTLEVNKYFAATYQEYLEKPVLMDLYSLNTLNFIYSYSLKTGRKSKFVFSGGYSLVLTEELYNNKTNYVLSKKSEDFIDLMAPGGIIIGVKFMI